MGSSHGFGSTASDWSRISHSLSLRLHRFRDLTLPDNVTRGLIMQKASGHPDIRLAAEQGYHSL